MDCDFSLKQRTDIKKEDGNALALQMIIKIVTEQWLLDDMFSNDPMLK